jgi:hypothetical protein
MKLSQTAIILAILAESQAYLAPQRSSAPTFSFLRSSATSNDAAFSAFADSLEVAPEPPKEKKTWQSKLDDLLNPTTTPAERQILLSELLSSNEQIRESVMDAMASRRVRDGNFGSNIDHLIVYVFDMFRLLPPLFGSI